jgi:hypothetical protein
MGLPTLLESLSGNVPPFQAGTEKRAIGTDDDQYGCQLRCKPSGSILAFLR